MGARADELEKTIEDAQKELKVLKASEKKEEVAQALKIIKRHGMTYSQVKKNLGTGNKGKHCQMCLTIHGTGQTHQSKKK
jgi:hypothetical protein